MLPQQSERERIEQAAEVLSQKLTEAWAEVDRLRDVYVSTMNVESSLTAVLTEIVRDSPDSENWSRAKARAALAKTGIGSPEEKA